MTVAQETLIKKFARLNRVNLALARKQFTEDGERLLSHVDRSLTSNDWRVRDAFADKWCEKYGLTSGKGSYWNTLDTLTGRHGLATDAGFDERYNNQYGVMGKDLAGPMWDHAMYLYQGGRVVAVGLAPYKFIDPKSSRLFDEDVTDFVDAVREMGLAIRVGFIQDQYYGFGSLPILIWNPNLVSLPVAR